MIPGPELGHYTTLASSVVPGFHNLDLQAQFKRQLLPEKKSMFLVCCNCWELTHLNAKQTLKPQAVRMRKERIEPSLSRVCLPFCRPIFLTLTFLPPNKLFHRLRGSKDTTLCPSSPRSRPAVNSVLQGWTRRTEVERDFPKIQDISVLPKKQRPRASHQRCERGRARPPVPEGLR